MLHTVNCNIHHISLEEGLWFLPVIGKGSFAMVTIGKNIANKLMNKIEILPIMIGCLEG